MMFQGMTGIAACVLLAGTAFGQCGAKAEACSGSDTVTMTVVDHHNQHAKHDIVETAKAAGSFETLLAAAKAAGLAQTLMGEGPYTVFAPTDEAFARLPNGTVENLLKPENRETLRAILTYHVVPGKVTADKVTRMSSAATVNGQRADIAAKDGTVKIDDATVVKADVMASNGVIHVIDRVIMPSSKNIVATADGAGSFRTLLAAAKAAGLAGALSGEGPYTVFAPTDEAFEKLGMGTVEDLLKPENKHKLASILKYHVVEGRVFATDAVKAGSASTLEGGDLWIGVDDARLTVNGVRISSTDLDASNGVIHVIDGVLLPG